MAPCKRKTLLAETWEKIESFNDIDTYEVRKTVYGSFMKTCEVDRARGAKEFVYFDETGKFTIHERALDPGESLPEELTDLGHHHQLSLEEYRAVWEVNPGAGIVLYHAFLLSGNKECLQLILRAFLETFDPVDHMAMYLINAVVVDSDFKFRCILGSVIHFSQINDLSMYFNRNFLRQFLGKNRHFMKYVPHVFIIDNRFEIPLEAYTNEIVHDMVVEGMRQGESDEQLSEMLKLLECREPFHLFNCFYQLTNPKRLHGTTEEQNRMVELLVRLNIVTVKDLRALATSDFGDWFDESHDPDSVWIERAYSMLRYTFFSGLDVSMFAFSLIAVLISEFETVHLIHDEGRDTERRDDDPKCTSIFTDMILRNKTFWQAIGKYQCHCTYCSFGEDEVPSFKITEGYALPDLGECNVYYFKNLIQPRVQNEMAQKRIIMHTLKQVPFWRLPLGILKIIFIDYLDFRIGHDAFLTSHASLETFLGENDYRRESHKETYLRIFKDFFCAE